MRVNLPPHPLSRPGIGTPEEREYWRRVDALVRERIESIGTRLKELREAVIEDEVDCTEDFLAEIDKRFPEL